MKKHWKRQHISSKFNPEYNLIFSFICKPNIFIFQMVSLLLTAIVSKLNCFIVEIDPYEHDQIFDSFWFVSIQFLRLQKQNINQTRIIRRYICKVYPITCPCQYKWFLKLMIVSLSNLVWTLVNFIWIHYELSLVKINCSISNFLRLLNERLSLFKMMYWIDFLILNGLKLKIHWLTTGNQ